MKTLHRYLSTIAAGIEPAEALTIGYLVLLALAAKLGRRDFITYKGKRTDPFRHSCFHSNPEVSSDLIQLIRYHTTPGEPGRPLEQIGPVGWTFPQTETLAESD